MYLLRQINVSNTPKSLLTKNTW